MLNAKLMDNMVQANDVVSFYSPLSLKVYTGGIIHVVFKKKSLYTPREDS